MCFDTTSTKTVPQTQTFKNDRARLQSKLMSMGQSSSELATKMGVPTSSIRRMVGELRASGVKVKTGYFGYSL